MADPSGHIIASLKEISWLLSLRSEDFFRSRAYGKAADAVARFSGDIGALVDSGRVADLDGIGARTALIIGELHQTGRCQLLSDLRKDFPREVGRLARLPGLGLSRLQILHRELGIETVEDLRQACASQAMAKVRGFGPATIKKIEAALTNFEDAPTRLLLPHARQLSTTLIALWSSRLGASLEVTGAVRRREPAIDAIELVAATVRSDVPELERIGALRRLDAIAQLPALRGFEGVLREGIPARLWLVPPAQRGAGLLVTTGPDALVATALDRAEVFDDERALLESAGLPYWPPEIRSMFAEGRTPPSLVEVSQLSGVVHAHSTDSDGRDDIRTLAEAAKELGYQYLTITDHSPSARYAHGVSLRDLRRQAEAIRAVEAEVGIRILCGTESDIQPHGGLDHPLDVLEGLDLVIASIHGRFRLDAEAMTERLLKTFDLPIRMIWGHPLGRLVLSRPPIAADLDRILDRIAERGHILEVNGDPHRMDLPPPWIREAKERGIRFVLSADAHSARGLRMAETAVDCGRAGGLEPADVLNTLDVPAFLEAVGPRGATRQ